MSVFKNKKQKVFVGLSGGVDSAVSAALLKKEGYEVVGVFIKIALPGFPCPAAVDRIEAMRVAAHLNIPFVEIDLSKQYEEEVFKISMKEFERGNTPNPDVLCNREIKFGTFYRFAMEHGADFVATGHYARVASQNNPRRVREFSAENSLSPRAVALRSPSEGHSVSLMVSKDSEKDQSYFLWAVPQEHLAKTLFPVGGLKKPEVRRLAKKFGLPNARRHDSQGLCFLGDLSIEDMLEQKIAPQEGKVLSEEGKVLGTHRGAALYTLGQRHGFEVQSEKPLFVIAKDIQKNTITVSHNRFPKNAHTTRLTLRDLNWIGKVVPGSYMARFRYRQKLIPTTLAFEGAECVATLLEPQYVPLGQSLVIYDGERTLGGGIIESATLE